MHGGELAIAVCADLARESELCDQYGVCGERGVWRQSLQPKPLRPIMKHGDRPAGPTGRDSRHAPVSQGGGPGDRARHCSAF